MTLRLTFGIDPGNSGAVSVIEDGEYKFTIDIPLMARQTTGNEIDGVALAESIRHVIRQHPGADVFACMESVHASPRNGASQNGRMCEAYGVLKGLLYALDIPLVTVSPQKWKGAYGLLADKEDERKPVEKKDDARVYAIERFPETANDFARKKDGGRADAFLIGLWAHRTQQAERFKTSKRRQAA